MADHYRLRIKRDSVGLFNDEPELESVEQSASEQDILQFLV
jgi:hypothetical protein